jgi:hypothetical protein
LCNTVVARATKICILDTNLAAGPLLFTGFPVVVLLVVVIVQAEVNEEV